MNNKTVKQELNLVPLVAIVAPIFTMIIVAVPMLTG